jgi:hypothetical protein
MKIQLRCPECGPAATPVVVGFAAFQEDGQCDVECESGHRVLTALQNHKFELLIDSAALALRDGYYREAVATFAASLESFWGFYVRVVARNDGASNEVIARLQRDIRLSERRLGAMCLAHVRLTGQPYKVDGQGWQTFRNDVVHNGLFPSRDTAASYGAHVYETIVAGMVQLEDRAPEATRTEGRVALERAVASLEKKRTDGSPAPQVLWLETLFTHEVSGGRSFEQAIRMWSDTAWGYVPWDQRQRDEGDRRQPTR